VLWELLDGDCKREIVKAIEEEEKAEKIAAAAAAGNEKVRKYSIFYRGPRVDILKMIAMLPVRRKANAAGSQVCEWWRKRLTVNSRVWSFFFGKSHMMEDPDAAISAMTLVCALTLTIPFSIMSYMNGTFFTDLKATLSNCPAGIGSSAKDSYDTVFRSMQQALWACVMCSIMGLTLSSVYYVFQPLPGKDLDGWCRNQGRVLFTSLIIVTMCAIVALLVLSSYLFTYYTVPTDDVCTYTAEYLFNPGAICLILTFVIAMWCMW
jgi:hypothetical protein